MTVTVPAKELEDFADRILTAAGLAPADARAAAFGLVEANLRGVDSHGVLRLIQYTASLAAGDVSARPRVRVIMRGGAAALIDAGGGYGYRPSGLAVDEAVDRAREYGIGVAGVRNSHHFGMAALYTARGARAGMITFAWTNASPRIAPPESTSAVSGNNPLSWAVPRAAPHPPIVLDMALTSVAFGKIRLAHAEGRPIPADWGLDRHGRATTDAAEAFASGLLGPIGAHKGYGLSLIGEILAGCLTGSPFGLDSNSHANPGGGVGHLFAAIRPDVFGDQAAFEARVEALVKQVKAIRTAGGGQARLPGEIEDGIAAARRRDGVPLSDALHEQLMALAERLGLAPLTR